MKRHIGSTIAIGLSVLFLVAGITNLPSGLMLAGEVTLLGALAYRSAKKRRLGEATNSMWRVSLEWGAMLLLIAAVVLQNDLKTRIVENPAVNVVPMVWAFVAYIVAVWPRKVVKT